MESALSWEHKALINELTQGMEKAKQLRYHLCSTTLSNNQDLLLQRILSSYQRALWILNGGGPLGHAQQVAPASGVVECSTSVNGSPSGSEELSHKSFRDQQGTTPKKRKLQPTWTEHVRVNSEYGLEGPTDEHSWRKYGQKDILGAKFPRSYYRCSHRPVQNCQATKQVQRSDDDPTVFEIIYKGTHTCNHSTIIAFPSPDKQEMTKSSENNQTQQNQTLLNLKANLSVNTKELERKETPAQFSFPSPFGQQHTEDYCFSTSGLLHDNVQGNYSPFFNSPATSESNYFSTPTYEIAERISANASTSNSPTVALEFPIDPSYIDPNFPFNIPGFFT